MNSVAYKSHAEVYIWPTVIDPKEADSNVGHASMLLRDAKGNERYFSLRPQSSGNLFWPTRGTVMPSVASDGTLEAQAEPSQRVKIPLTEEQHSLMSEKMDVLSRGIQEGRVSYQLTPGASIVSLFRSLFSSQVFFEEMRRCPMTGSSFDNARTAQAYQKDMKEAKQLEVHHCASSVATILQHGGVLVPMSHTPWKTTPTELGEYTTRLSQDLNRQNSGE